MSDKTPEQRAEERHPSEPPTAHGLVFTHMHSRSGYASCIRELVEPLEQERDRLRKFIEDIIQSECWAVDDPKDILPLMEAVMRSTKTTDLSDNTTTEP